MGTNISKRKTRVDRILDFLRTYSAFIENYGGCVKSVDLLCGCNRQFTIVGSILMQDIIKAYNQYSGGQLNDLYRSVCKNHDKRMVYQKTLLTDWKRAINTFYSCGLSIPGLTEKEAIEALKTTYKLVK